MQVSVKVDIDNALKTLDSIPRFLVTPAAARALNWVAADVARVDMPRIMQHTFDRPVPYTLRATRYDKATPERPWTRIYLNDEPSKGVAPAQYLIAEIKGGKRADKALEKRLRNRGLLWPGEAAIVGSNYLDMNGNIRPGYVQRILSALQANFDPTSDSKTKSKRARFFIPKAGSRLPRGVWEHRGKYSVLPVFIFAKPLPSYRPRFPFQKHVKAIYTQRFDAAFRRAMAYEGARWMK